MAKGRSSRNRSRDPSESLTVTLRTGPNVARPMRRRLSLPLLSIDDRRTFDFEPGSRPARLFSGGVASVGLVPNVNRGTSRKSKVPYQIAFTAPDETLVCVRRKRRKEVLFAKKKTGKRGQRKPRFNMWSKYKC